MKTIWMALRDMLDVDQARRVHGPDGEIHQAGQKNDGEHQNAVNHFAFRDQVHEETGDEGSLGAGDEEGDGNVDGAVAEGNVGSQHGDARAKKQGIKHVEVAAHHLVEILRMFVTHSQKLEQI